MNMFVFLTVRNNEFPKIKKCIFYLLYDTIKLYANKFLAFWVLIMKFKSTLDNKLSIPAKVMLTKTAATDNMCPIMWRYINSVICDNQINCAQNLPYKILL